MIVDCLRSRNDETTGCFRLQGPFPIPVLKLSLLAATIISVRPGPIIFSDPCFEAISTGCNNNLGPTRSDCDPVRLLAPVLDDQVLAMTRDGDGA